MRVAIAGNPNSGKTSLFNALTHSRGKVGNYTGVTVERREAALYPARKNVTLVDLPGCYSLTARSAEEDVAQRVLLGDLGDLPCDGVVCVLDVTQLGRGLYLLLQLKELGFAVKAVLTMLDLGRERGLTVDVPGLSRLLDLPILVANPRTGEGVRAIARAIAEPWPAPQPYAGLTRRLNETERTALAPIVRALEAESRWAPVRELPSLALWLLVSQLPTLGLTLSPALRATVEAAQREVDPAGSGAFGRRIIGERFRAVDAILRTTQRRGPAVDRRSQAIDEVMLHPVLGTGVLVATLFALFQAVFAGAKPLMDGIGALSGHVAQGIAWAVPESLTQSLLVHGVLGGVANVLTFVPQIALLFFLLGLLEESGYMARAALLLDRLMRGVGLNGRAFVPLLSSFACAVPGIMAARTLEGRRDRLVTMFIAPFMGCSARLPVYTLVVAATFAQTKPLAGGLVSVGGLVIFSMYVLGFLAALGTAALLQRTALAAPHADLMMELPAYRWPPLGQVTRTVAERCGRFVRGTGGTIVTLSVLLWALLTFPVAHDVSDAALAPYAQARGVAAITDETRPPLVRAYALEHTFAGTLGRAFEPVIAPLGFDWRIGVGLLASFAAREVLVSTLAQVYALDAEADSATLVQALQADVHPVTQAARFTPLTGVSLMVFFVLAMQCMSTLATLRKETGGWRWPLAALAYMNGLAYVASLLVYQGGRWLGYV